LVFTKFQKIVLKQFFPKIPCTNCDKIWVKTRHISRQTNEYSPTKKIKQFHTQTNLPFNPAVMNKVFIENLVGRIWGSNLSQNSIDTMKNVCKIFRPRVRVNKTSVPKTKCPDFSSLYVLFVICLWTYVLSRVQTTHESTCVNFSTQFFNTEQNCRKYGEISQILLEYSLGFSQKFRKIVPK